MTGRLLVVDDDEVSCRLVAATFAAEGLDVMVARDGRSGLSAALDGDPDVVLLDVHLPDIGGLDVLDKLKAERPWLPVVMLTASREVRHAIRALQSGAMHYITKPIDHDELLVVVTRALEARALKAEVEQLRRRVVQGETDTLAQQMGSSPAIRAIIDQVGTVAASGFTVLILGETGAGKELVARAIHQQSDRRLKPFVALDCGAIPETLLESELFGHERGAFTGADRRKPGSFQLAEGGTCFLDEVGNLPIQLQAKLLRVLESKQVQPVGSSRPARMDVRFIAATNNDLQARVAQGLFRADLYFRLAQYTMTVPPLRERPEDIAYLAHRFLEEARIELRRPVRELSPEAIGLLKQQPWPGNVRELRNAIRRAVLQATDLTIHPHALRLVMVGPPGGPGEAPAVPPSEAASPNGRTLKEVAEHAAREAERRAIIRALRASRGNKSQAAKALRTDYKTLHLKMKSLTIRADDFRTG